MANTQKLILKRMGVMNVTPNSFSDGGELKTAEDFQDRLKMMGEIEALDVGAESTAPMNEAIDFCEEWKRLEPFIDIISKLNIPISLDTYHEETIEKMSYYWLRNRISTPLIWNDVSGKMDENVKRFLALSDNFFYVFCHNLAPIRELSGRHMETISPLDGEAFLDEVASHLREGIHPRVILDPTLGFSKTYEQNWYLLQNFGELQRKVGHNKWLLGYSRKSFLRKKLGLDKITKDNREELDLFHSEVLDSIRPSLHGEVWIRTHRPDLISR